MIPNERPDSYTAQIESPLFHLLPRELSDEIYEYYVLAEDGYHHNCDTDRFSLANREPIDLPMMYSHASKVSSTLLARGAQHH
jgi:hypothetical protein